MASMIHRRAVCQICLFVTACSILASAAQGQYLFWNSAGSGGTIMRANLDGSNVVTLFLSQNPPALVVDPIDHQIYWTVGSSIRRGNFDGSGFANLLTVSPTTSLALDAYERDLYLVGYAIRRLDLDLLQYVTLVFGGSYVDIELDISSARLFWTKDQTSPAPDLLVRANLSAADSETLATGILGQFAVDPVHHWIYLVDNNTTIRRTSLDGTAGLDLITAPYIRNIAVDPAGQHVYWTEQFTGRIMRMGLAGENPTVVIGGQSQPITLAVFNPTDCNSNSIEDWCDYSCGNPGGPCDVPGCGGAADCDRNGVLDVCEPVTDCNSNTINDRCELQAQTVEDCNENFVPDECDGVPSAADDCNGNQLFDLCEIKNRTVPDCNVNWVPDSCDIAAGTSSDCNANQVPDECEDDCNDNGVPDDCDVAGGTSPDCDENGNPDECDPDCNGNNVPDECDVAGGTSPDCDNNNNPDECDPDCNNTNVPDICDVLSGTSLDCNSNLYPDECDVQQSDCNGSGVPDECDVTSGASESCDQDLIPDECEVFYDCNNNSVRDSCDVESGTSADVDANWVPDECCAPPCVPEALGVNDLGTCTQGVYAECSVNGQNCPPDRGTCDRCAQVRYISFTIPAAAYGEDRAIRIRLDSLHHPTPPPPGTAPSFSLLEGQDRYLNTVAGAVSRCCNPNSYPTSCNSVVNCSSDANCAGLGVNSKCFKNLCPDSPAFATFFRCAYVSCNPQYRDWSDFSGSMTYATGETIIPSSSYSVSQLSASCAGNEANCPAASAPLIVTTERWTNLDCSEGNHGIPNAIDISQVVDKVKDSRFIKPRTQFRSALLNPLTLVSAQDAARVVDAVKGFQYPFNINCTTLCNNNAQCQSGLCTGSPSHCSAPNTCASNADCVGLQGGHTCSANGFCTNVKDSCSGLCQP